MASNAENLNLDLDSLEEDELSCELKIFSDSVNDDGNKPKDHANTLDAESGTLLDWSVSEISCATGLNAPDRFYTDFEPSSTSASAWSSPEKVSRAKQNDNKDVLVEDQTSIQTTPNTILKGGNIREKVNVEAAVDIKHLVDNIRNLRSSIDAIQQKTITPVNSPRRTKPVIGPRNISSSASEDDGEISVTDKCTTPKAKGYSHYGVAFNSTPPVKDPGLAIAERTNSLELYTDGKNIDSQASYIPRETVEDENDKIVEMKNVEVAKSNDLKSTSSEGMNQMRIVLKNLENARKKYDKSKLPKRNLNFDDDSKQLKSFDTTKNNSMKTSTSELAQVVNRTEPSNEALQQNLPIYFPTDTKKLLDREFEEMSAFLEEIKHSSPALTTKLFSPLESGRLALSECTTGNRFDSGSNVALTEMLDKTKKESTDSLKTALKKEIHSRAELENTVLELKIQIQHQSEQITTLEKANNEKLNLLLDVKLKWTEVSQQWMESQKDLEEKLTKSNTEIDQLNAESQGVKEQFSICQEELQKALKVATDFKTKLEEEEKIKNDVLNELLSQKTSKVKQLQIEQGKLEELKIENKEFMEQIEKLRNEKELLQNSHSDEVHQASTELITAKEYIDRLTLENQDMNEKFKTVSHEKQAMESSLHTFYASQMESILTEKISTLQSNVKIWETNMAREKQEAVEFLQDQHVIQMESLNERHLKDMENSRSDMKALNATLSATRKEADALREQLGLERNRSEASNGKYSSDLVRPSVPSNRVTTSSALNSGLITLHDRNGLIPVDPLRSFSIHYNDQRLSRIDGASAEDEETIRRREQLWSELLGSTAHALPKNPLFSRVQNNLHSSPLGLSSKREMESMNGNSNNDNVVSSTSEDTKEGEYSRRDIHGKMGFERSTYKSRSLRHKHKSKISELDERRISANRFLGNGKQPHPLTNSVSEIDYPADNHSSNDRQIKKENEVSIATDSQKLNSISNSIVKQLIENTSVNENGGDDVMTMEEKKEIVRSFVEKFFKDHPEAVLDPQLLFELNTMTLRLVDQSPNTNGIQSLTAPDDTTLSRTSHFELKKMLAQQFSRRIISRPFQFGVPFANNEQKIITNNSFKTDKIQVIPNNSSSSIVQTIENERDRRTQKTKPPKDICSSDS